MTEAHPLAGAGHVAAIDLGGTKILAAIFGPDGSVLTRAKVATDADQGAAAVVDRMAEAVREAASEAGIEPASLEGVGVGAPGPIAEDGGVVQVAPNLGWEKFPLRDELHSRLGRPVYLGNDVSVAVLAEHRAGVGRGTQHMVGIWPGTGVGGGIIANGHLYGGAHQMGGEIGHITVRAGGPKCGCGGRGHLEALCSRTAIVKEIAKQAKRGAKTDLGKFAGKDLTKATSGDLRKAYERGDRLVVKVLDRAAKYLALGIASAANLLNPELVVLGGGVVEALGDPFVERVRALTRRQPLEAVTRDLRIEPSELGDDAGITGAALLVRTRGTA
jgi:glucokinase